MVIDSFEQYYHSLEKSLTEPDLDDEQMTEELSPEHAMFPKLKWSCKPAIAGYIVAELIRAGYIEPPTTNGELSYAKLGSICNQLFTVAGHNPTPESWRKVLNPDSNTLADYKRKKLKLPDCSDIS